MSADTLSDWLDEVVGLDPLQIEPGWDYPHWIFGWEQPDLHSEAGAKWAKKIYEDNKDAFGAQKLTVEVRREVPAKRFVPKIEPSDGVNKELM